MIKKIGNKGVSFLHVLLMSAALGAMAVQIANLGKHKGSMIKRSRVINQLGTSTNMINAVLSHQTLCDKALAGKDFNSTGIEIDQIKIEDITITDAANADLYKVGTVIDGKIEITKIWLDRFTQVSNNYFIGKFNIEAGDPREKLRWTRVFNLSLLTNADNRIETCSAGANSLVTNTNTSTAPIIIPIWHDHTLGWKCEKIDLETPCGDADGCKIAVRMQHKTYYDQVRYYEANINMEQSGMSNNVDPFRFGTLTGEAGEVIDFYLGRPGAFYNIFRPWSWVHTVNYHPNWCWEGGSDGGLRGGAHVVFSGAEKGQFVMAVHPLVKATLYIYDN